jgi:hypothetical protein
MSSPVEAPIREDEFKSLVSTLGELRADSIAADTDERSTYGLDDPKATVVVTYAASEKPDAASESVELTVTEHRGKVYARRGDHAAVYLLARKFYDQIFAEYRTEEVLAFDESVVRGFAIRKGDDVHAFERGGDGWTYQAEPDLPLDTTKVENLLLQLKDLKTERYVAYGDADLDAFGLAQPYHEVTVTLDDGSAKVLWVSDQLCPEDPDKGFYASVQGERGVFLLAPATVRRFAVSLDALESKP